MECQVVRLYRRANGTWAGTQASAGKGHTQVDVPTDKPGLLEWLNEKLGADNREAAFSDEKVSAVMSTPYMEWSVAIDDEWDKLPLSRQLHFAALAMETARSVL